MGLHPSIKYFRSTFCSACISSKSYYVHRRTNKRTPGRTGGWINIHTYTVLRKYKSRMLNYSQCTCIEYHCCNENPTFHGRCLCWISILSVFPLILNFLPLLWYRRTKLPAKSSWMIGLCPTWLTWPSSPRGERSRNIVTCQLMSFEKMERKGQVISHVSVLEI